MINNFTKDFHNANFFGTGAAITVDWSEFWTNTAIPWLELELNLNTLASYQWVLDHQHLFIENLYQKAQKQKNKDLGHDWFCKPNSDGWEALYVLGDPPVFKNLIGNSNSIPLSVNPVLHHDAIPDFQLQLKALGITVTKLEILKLKVGGWIQPHMDKKYTDGQKNLTLNRVWTPLHDFSQCLKVYPFGYIAHKTGNGYLLNNENFMHSVVNQDRVDRYVAIWSFDVDTFPMELLNKLKSDFYKRWSDSNS
jgi:hypothetical protein